jgi:spore coat protein U-like protein
MRSTLLACALTGALFASASAQAASSTGNLNVSATVNASCVVVGAGTMDFGNYDPAGANNATAKDVDGTFNVRCTKGTSAKIWLLEGGFKTGTSSCTTPERQMASGANRLAYFLYQNTGRTTPWGCLDASSPTAYVSTSSNTSAPQTVYGRIPAGQDVAVAANYADVVTIQLNF